MTNDTAHALILGTAVDAGPVALLVTDGSMHFVGANRAACELFGYSREQLLSMRATEVSTEDDRGSKFRELVAIGELQGLLPLRRSDGSILVARYFSRKVDPDGSRYVTVLLPRRVIPAGASPQEDAGRRGRGPSGSLSARESEILEALADGLENEEIGRALHLATDTVKAHVSRLLHKLGARNRTHLVVLGLRLGLID